MMGFLHPMWERALSEDEDTKNAALKEIADCGYNYSLPGMIMACTEE